MNLDFLKNVDRKYILLGVSLLILVVLIITSSVLKKHRRRVAAQVAVDTSVTSIPGSYTIKNVRFSNIKIKKHSDTNFDITATITNVTAKPINEFTFTIVSSNSSETALVPALGANESRYFFRNVSIDLNNKKKIKLDAKTLSLQFLSN